MEHDRLRAENARLRDELAATHAEVERLRGADADAVVWARRVTEGIEIMKDQLAAMTAARDEACDLAEANIFAPGPIDASEGTLAVHRSYTVTIDSSKPHRDKVRVAELRKVGAP